MDAADLRIFEAVARLGSMSRAALALNTVQSNVTAHIRQMEARLGLALFERGGRGVRLTAAGARLLPQAGRVLRALEDARRAVLDDGTPRGPLCLGALETTTAIRLGPALHDFVTAHPAVDLTLRTGTTAELLERVLAQEVEGAFLCGPVAHPALEVEPVWKEELVLLAAPGTRPLARLLAGEGDVRIIVLRAGCSYRQRLEDVLARRGIPAPRLLEFGTLEAIFASVAAGLGITLLPRALVGPAVKPGRLSVEALPRGEGEVETVFARRRDCYASGALRAFLEIMRRTEAQAVEAA
ncbi:LysR family transcriptional regulator [Belnapia sp. T18]|uniref:LysR family transcriptional regulator n=1 Tax=Belnapia arida TaxID=2804533 RepID=A0ABS1U5H4_9PROT|nr:LysR family transcriptional regulator [Belnapia arida]MBL6079941.1 LysR family transcriptional regulator [Belnapia arida]